MKVQIIMDDRGQLYDNILFERLCRSVKYDEVYLHDYISVQIDRNGLGKYFGFNDTERFHVSLGRKIPHDIHF